MTTPTFTPSDIVKFAAAKDAVNISTAFDQLVGQKIVDAIDARKQYVASTMFGQEDEQEVQASAEEQESEEASDEVDDTVGSQEQSEQETEGSNEDAEQHA